MFFGYMTVQCACGPLAWREGSNGGGPGVGFGCTP